MDIISQLVEEFGPKPYGVIYFILNKLTGKYYIGQTVQGIIRRCKQHIHDAYHRRERWRNNYFYNALKYYGPENFEARVILSCPDQKTLDEAETYFISFFGSTNKLVGYNNAVGGGNGPLTEECKKRIREAKAGQPGHPHTEKTKEKISRANKGKKKPPVADETKRKMSLVRTGKTVGPCSDQTKEKIRNTQKGKPRPDRTGPRSEETKANMRAGWARRRERLASEAELKEPSDS